jgi:hypothetical protein
MTFHFSKQWEHAGRLYEPGDVAELTPQECDKLARLGAGEPDSVTEKPKRKRK